MNKKRIFNLGIGVLLGIPIVGFASWTAITIKNKNEEIASLKKKLSQEQSNRLIDILKFGQWKLQVEELAEENAWVLPEMSDSIVLDVDGFKFEGNISAEITGDSIHVIEESVKLISNEDSVNKTD